MENPLVSIIIPTYNRAHLISETLDSVLAQTYTNWECIVVDDGSTDGTDELLASYCKKDNRFQYHHRPKDRFPGGNTARNYGFVLSRGAYVQWFDDDDVMLPEFLSLKIAQFSTNKIEFVICTGFLTNEFLAKKEIIGLIETDQLYKDYARIRLNIFTPSVLFKRQFLEGINLFDELLVRGQEMDLFLRLFFLKKPEQYKIINRALFLYRQHVKTKTESDKNYNLLNKESQTKIYIANLKRSLDLKDNDLIVMFYRYLVKYFIEGIKYNHYTNSRAILKSLVGLVGTRNSFLKFELRFLGSLCLFFKYPSYRVYLRLRYHPVLNKL